MRLIDTIVNSMEAALEEICIIAGKIGKQFKTIDESPPEERLLYLKAASNNTGLSLDELSKLFHQLAKLAYLSGITMVPNASPKYECKKQRLKIKR